MAKRPELVPPTAKADLEEDEERDVRPRPGRTKKINRDLFAKIKTARKESIDHANKATTHNLQSQAANTAMQLFIAQALADLGLSVASYAVCLNCSSARPADQQGQPPQPCPGCGTI